MYIQKEIELNKTGVTSDVWAVDVRNVNWSDDMSQLTVRMKGYKTVEKMNENETSNIPSDWVLDVKYATVTSADLELDGSIGFANIPKLYEVLTTKTVEKTDEEGNVTTEPAYPDFFGGEIIETN